MLPSIAEYYLTEMNSWKNTIDSYIQYMYEAEGLLNEMINFDTIPKLAAKVEHHLNQLILFKENLILLKNHIQSLESQLYKEQSPIENKMITEDLEKLQQELRNNLYKIEKEYLDVKYDCDNFLAETVLQQNQKNSGSPP